MPWATYSWTKEALHWEAVKTAETSAKSSWSATNYEGWEGVSSQPVETWASGGEQSSPVTWRARSVARLPATSREIEARKVLVWRSNRTLGKGMFMTGLCQAMELISFWISSQVINIFWTPTATAEPRILLFLHVCFKLNLSLLYRRVIGRIGLSLLPSR